MAPKPDLAERRYLPLLSGSLTPAASSSNARNSSTPSSSATITAKKRNFAVVFEKCDAPKGTAKKSRQKRTPASTTTTSEAGAIRAALPRHLQLRALRVRDPTLIRYHEAIKEFASWFSPSKPSWRKPASLDAQLAGYFTDLFEDGAPYTSASYALFGCLLLRIDSELPERQLCPRACQALKGWQSKCPTSTRSGADPLIWYLMAEHLCNICPQAAAALLLQLDTYARPSEILNVKRKDIVRPTSKHCKYWGIVFGNSESDELTKTNAQDDTVLQDSTDRSYAAILLERLFHATPSPDSFIFPDLSLAQYENHFTKAKKSG